MYPGLPRFSQRPVHVRIPEATARHIDPVFPVFRDSRNDALVSPFVDRLEEWVGRLRIPDRALFVLDGVAASMWLRALWPPEEDAVNGERTRGAVLAVYSVLIARRWTKGSPRERSTLRDLASERGISVNDVKVDAVRSGLYLAFLERGELARVRLGNRWSDGKVSPSEDVDLRDFFRWFWAQSLRHARQELRGAHTERRAMESQPEESTGLYDALEAHENACQDLEGLLELATPRQREIVQGLLERLRDGLAWPEAQASVADDLGITPATLRVQLHRLRHKVA